MKCGSIAPGLRKTLHTTAINCTAPPADDCSYGKSIGETDVGDSREYGKIYSGSELPMPCDLSVGYLQENDSSANAENNNDKRQKCQPWNVSVGLGSPSYDGGICDASWRKYDRLSGIRRIVARQRNRFASYGLPKGLIVDRRSILAAYFAAILA